jgi:hypothetical protein
VSGWNLLEIVIFAVCLSPIWGAFAWELWEGSIRPGLIPRDEIVAEADKLWAIDDDRAFDKACIEERAAWYRSNSFEQGRWRRIRCEIMRRERARGTTFRKMRRTPDFQ